MHRKTGGQRKLSKLDGFKLAMKILTEINVKREDLEFIFEVLKGNVDDVGLAISIIQKYLCETSNENS